MMSPFIRTSLKPFYTCSELPPFSSCCSTTGCSCSYTETMRNTTSAPCLLPSLTSEEQEISQAYYAQVQIPDRVGIFKLRLSYARPGYRPLLVEKQIVVRHFSHHEYPRLVAVSFPYYLAMLSLLLGGLLFAAIVLYYQNRDKLHATVNSKDAKTEKSPILQEEQVKKRN